MSPLLLLSNSTNYGYSFLEHARTAIAEFVGQKRELAFVPFALADHVRYGELVADALAELPLAVRVVTPDENGAKLISEASVVFVGGGNTFRLLKTIQDMKVLQLIRERHADGELSYIGSSAGTNLACPTIRTTNDMPIVSPDGFESLGLVPFQINAHFQDDDAFTGHMGETRRTRLNEFLEENDTPVLALREGAWIERATNGKVRLDGENGAILFHRSKYGVSEVRLGAGDDLTALTSCSPHFDSPAAARA